MFIESYHGLYIVNCFFKPTVDAQYVPLFIISFIFCIAGLYFTENGIESRCLDLECFKSNDLCKWSALSI